MSPNAHFLYMLQFLSRNVTFFALKHSSRSILAARCENGPQTGAETLYTYEKHECVAKIMKTRNYYYFASEIDQNWSKLQETHFRVFTGVARNHSKLTHFHHFPWQSENSSRNVTFFALKRLSRCIFAKSCDFGLILGLETLYTSEISESVPEKTKTRNHCYFPSQIYEIPWKFITKVFRKH